MTGLIWFGTKDYQSVQQARHACEQGDGLDSYTWTQYDPREGGIQEIKDSRNNVKITTEFLKVPGGDHGGSWAARVKGEPINPDVISRVSTVFYFGLDGMGGLEMETDENENGLEGPITFTGSSPDLDDFAIRVEDGPENHIVTRGTGAEDFGARVGKTHFAGYRAAAGSIWQAKDLIMGDIFKRAGTILEPFRGSQSPTGVPDPSFVLQLADEVYFGSNLYAVQKTFDGPFQFDVFFESGSAQQKLTSETIDNGIEALSSSFTKRFGSIFPVPAQDPSLQKFSEAITSNLLGGVGYFYGSSIEDRGFAYEWDQDEEDVSAEGKSSGQGPTLTEPRELLTGTPSRSFFPRGFYWDEGFHLLHIGEWDNALSLEILKDWIALIDEDGWVGREQILGEEARSRVPAEFQTQVPTFANPPTLSMAVTAFIHRLKSQSSGPSDQDLGMGSGFVQTTFNVNPERSDRNRHLLDQEEAHSFLNSIYGPLRRHYDWFRRTQRGQIKQYGRKARSRTEGYRWRGRSEKHVLTSGMDDYPRGPPHAGELHLDLISWMGFFTRTMREIAEFIGENDDATSFAEIEEAIVNNIDDLHWSEEENTYCDIGVDSDDESQHICHRGYLSLFPFLLSLLPADSPRLDATLDLLRDPNHLWSPYGIRSLSASHPEYGQGENYWKGPIWMQMNYMALSSLYKVYAAQEGPYQDKARKIYDELRDNVIKNVHKEYERTGYVWEQYDANNGEGRRSHPFTGWTSLVTLIMSEKY